MLTPSILQTEHIFMLAIEQVSSNSQLPTKAGHMMIKLIQCEHVSNKRYPRHPRCVRALETKVTYPILLAPLSSVLHTVTIKSWYVSYPKYM